MILLLFCCFSDGLDNLRIFFGSCTCIRTLRYSTQSVFIPKVHIHEYSGN